MSAAAQLVLPTPLAEPHTGWPFVTVISVTGVSHRVEAGEVWEKFYQVAEHFRWYTSWGYSEVHYVHAKGITWIPGWHAPDSPEVNALKTAFALKETR